MRVVVELRGNQEGKAGPHPHQRGTSAAPVMAVRARLRVSLECLPACLPASGHLRSHWPPVPPPTVGLTGSVGGILGLHPLLVRLLISGMGPSLGSPQSLA